MTATSDGAEHLLKIRLAELWSRSRATILSRVATIEAAAAVLTAGGRLGSEERRNAEREAHKLAGAAGSFGYPTATDLAREAEELLAGTAPIDHSQALRLARLAARLLEELAEDADSARARL